MSMRIAVLYPDLTLDAVPVAAANPEATPAWVAPEHTYHHVMLHKATSVAETSALVRGGGFDAFVNLCDGALDEPCAGIEVIEELERLNAVFTGAGSSFYEPPRARMKSACRAAGIGCPAGVMVTRPEEVGAVLDQLRFPMIVKHPSSYGSVGMGRDARCQTRDELRRQVEKNLAAFGGALVEEYIAGREFTVLVAEAAPGERRPRVFPPIEICFPPGEEFKHAELKWVRYEEMTAVGVEEELGARLAAQAAAFFKALGGSGYGRCDVRMDADGRLFTLEINPNCAVFFPPHAFGAADLIVARSPGGHRAFLDHILATAFARSARSAERAPSREGLA